MTEENFCWLVVGFIAGRFVGDSVREGIKQLFNAVRARGEKK